MDYLFLTNHITKKYSKNEKLIKSVFYQLSILDEFELKIINKILEIQTIFNSKYNTNYNILFISTIIIYFYNSINLNFNLPNILDRVMFKKIPSLHVIYNEAISQLTSMIFITESIDLFNNELLNLFSEEKYIEAINENYYIIIDSISINTNIENLLINNENKDKIKEVMDKELENYKNKFFDIGVEISENIFKKLLNIQ